jgi:hypothetical protein
LICAFEKSNGVLEVVDDLVLNFLREGLELGGGDVKVLDLDLVDKLFELFLRGETGVLLVAVRGEEGFSVECGELVRVLGGVLLLLRLGGFEGWVRRWRASGVGSRCGRASAATATGGEGGGFFRAGPRG